MRRTHDQVRADAIVAERSGVLAMVDKHRAGVAVAVRTGKLSADDAELINRHVASFAESCAIGLHVEGETPATVRAAMRPLVRALSRG
jgi:hypothetical protein